MFLASQHLGDETTRDDETRTKERKQEERIRGNEGVK